MDQGKNNPSNPPSVVSLGGAIKLLRTTVYVDAVSGAWTEEEFELLCKKLGVPIVAIGNALYIEPIVFEAAFSARLLPGSPNFNTPGSKRARVGGTVGINPKTAIENFDVALESVLKRRKIYGSVLTRELRNMLGRGSRTILKTLESDQ